MIVGVSFCMSWVLQVWSIHLIDRPVVLTCILTVYSHHYGPCITSQAHCQFATQQPFSVVAVCKIREDPSAFCALTFADMRLPSSPLSLLCLLLGTAAASSQAPGGKPALAQHLSSSGPPAPLACPAGITVLENTGAITNSSEAWALYARAEAPWAHGLTSFQLW